MVVRQLIEPAARQMPYPPGRAFWCPPTRTPSDRYEKARLRRYTQSGGIIRVAGYLRSGVHYAYIETRHR